MIIFWLPYYLVLLGYEHHSLLISLGYPVGTTIASLLLVPLVGQVPEQSHKITIAFLLANLLVTSSIFLTGSNISSVPIYGLQVIASSLLFSVPISRVSTVELTEKVQDAQEKYLVLNVMRLIKDFVTALSLLFVGVLIERVSIDL